jgi:hypothetical protein
LHEHAQFEFTVEVSSRCVVIGRRSTTYPIQGSAFSTLFQIDSSPLHF